MKLPPRHDRAANAIVFVWLTLGICSPSMPLFTQINKCAFGCEDCQPAQSIGDDVRANSTSVFEKLQLDSDLQVIGHPLAMSDMLSLIYVADPDMAEFIQSWQIPIAIDRKRLARAGITLDRIVIRRFYGLGVCRRSALRLILAEASLGYAVIDNRIILTTKEIADSLGNSVSDRPTILGLTHADVMVRRNITFAAGNLQLDVNEFLAPLIAGLHDEDRDVRFNSAYAIAGFGADADGAVKDLVEILVADDPTMRQVAKYSLSRIGQSAITPLLAAVENRDDTSSEFAAWTIAEMGITGRAATEGLIGVATRHIAIEPQINEEHCGRCRAIAMAVAQVSTVEERNSIPRLLGSNSPREREFALYVIGEIGSCEISSKEISREDLEQKLEALLFDQSVSVRRAAAWAFANLDVPLEAATKSLDAGSRDTDREVVLWANEALRKLRSIQKQ